QEQGHLSSELHGSLLRARMVPFGTVVPRLRHQLRHTAREVSKQAELQIVGEDVGVDRTILESMTEAFEHMIRNAVGHGIETPEQRVAARKPPMGCIRIECTLEGSEVRLQFSDDGRGLNVDDIRTRALSRGLIDQGALLSDQELLQLIVAPGFSTIDSVTELSGRGVGMDVVHSAVRRLGGTISVQSRVHEGTTFSMRLPVSLAMTQAVFVRCGNHTFAVSLRAVETISEVPLNSLSNDETTGEPLLAHQNHRYPLMNLTERFGLLSMAPKHDNVPILLARMGATHVAVQVDELVGTQEIVVKKVGAHLGGLEGIAGAAVRGDGRPVLVLDVVDLWVSEEATNGKLRLTDDDHADQSPLVMVVDDSLTVRKVTSRNLTRHGMRVAMAKDGVNALDQVKSQLPDIMLIDVEMPRMDGYELTARIRAHPATRAIPIIMVTSRAGEKHRHRALELGADAYITKPYHEDELVVEVRRLLGARKKVGSDNDKTVIH
ncbi:MAG: response regulator, partial [Gammaproteobacteria bacterium]|nr:response regulator [Gammaproteobacteria bacterium]